MARISLGSHSSDGLRSGPIYSQINKDEVTPLPGTFPLLSGNYSKFGPGILRSPQHSYKIWPNIPNIAGGYNILNNLAAAIRPLAAGNIPLRGDNRVTFRNVGPDGLDLIQFDWPRVPTVTIAGVQAAAAPTIYVTIFGYDWYGFPLQHTYTVGGETVLPRTYPTVTPGAGANDGAIINPQSATAMPVKAFYQVTRAYISAPLPVGCTISLGASDIFGLPYAVYGKGAFTSIQWATQTNSNPQTYPNANAIVEVSELTTRVIGAPQTTTGVFVPGDITTPAAADTGDVRGLYAPSSPASVRTVGGVDIDIKRLVFTYYVAGMDTWNNQVNNAQDNYMQEYKVTSPNGWPVSVLYPSLAYGEQQYYTGVPFA